MLGKNKPLTFPSQPNLALKARIILIIFFKRGASEKFKGTQD
jgi:hypothetical protein